MAPHSLLKSCVDWFKKSLGSGIIFISLSPTLAFGGTQSPEVLFAQASTSSQNFSLGRKDSRGPPTREIINREEMHRWERYIRGFRSEHNFALTAGITSGNWRVKRLGPVSGDGFKGSGFMSRFQYSFHLQLYRGLGYLLGSGFGYHYESADLRQRFRPTPSVQFPGLVAGLVLNMNPMFRASVTTDTYLERHDGIDAGDEPEITSISVTLKAFDVGVACDIFYDLLWAFRVEAHRRHLSYNRPIIPSNQTETANFAVNASFSKDDTWLGFGLVFHLL